MNVRKGMDGGEDGRIFVSLSLLLSVGADVAGTSQRVKLEKKERKDKREREGETGKNVGKEGSHVSDIDS